MNQDKAVNNLPLWQRFLISLIVGCLKAVRRVKPPLSGFADTVMDFLADLLEASFEFCGKILFFGCFVACVLIGIGGTLASVGFIINCLINAHYLWAAETAVAAFVGLGLNYMLFQHLEHRC